MQQQEYGLTSSEVAAAQSRYGKNELALHRVSLAGILFRQLNNPLLIILAVTTVIAYVFDDHINASIILGIISISVGLGFVNEYSSERTVDGLLKKVSLSAFVIRNGIKQDVPVAEVAVGDIVLLHQGTVVPADIVLLEVSSLTVDEAALTGESMPVPKQVTDLDTKPGRAFMGTVVASGSGVGKVVAIGQDTELGRVSTSVNKERDKTAFQKGLNHLGSLMAKIITIMAIGIGALNILLGKPPLEAILFALAIAIGLTPALLPVIVTVSMAHGARQLAKRKVIVKELVSIEDLGNIDILCTDKTGTLTEGAITLTGFFDMQGKIDRSVLERAMTCNTASHHHRIVGNPMDTAIWHYALGHDIKLSKPPKKLFEEEFNYDYRGQFTVIEDGTKATVLFKGTTDSVLERGTSFVDATGQIVPVGHKKKALQEMLHELNRQGLRLIVVGEKEMKKQETYSIEDVQGLRLLGYLTFLDVPKHSAKHALMTMQRLGISLKIITGDNERVTEKICHDIGIEYERVVTGPEMEAMNEGQLLAAVEEATIFARVNPQQKEQVVRALRQVGHTVAYLGDGVNDAAALHAADVSISVNTAVDVAKDVASVVLLHKGLEVIAEGVEEGRRIFANTIKYILMGTSSNFGNMFSVAGASFFLPFLPMTPSQILLNNSLYDLSQLGLPSDQVDPEVLLKPRHWDVAYIYRYMLFFGPISSLFDYLSFAILWFGFHASEREFQTGWFLESIATQVLIVFIIRTNRFPFYKSKPAQLLLTLCILVLAIAMIMPYTPVAGYVHLVPLPPLYFLALIALVVSYLAVVDQVKKHFLSRVSL